VSTFIFHVMAGLDPAIPGGQGGVFLPAAEEPHPALPEDGEGEEVPSDRAFRIKPGDDGG
jgi:hypothetical protein